MSEREATPYTSPEAGGPEAPRARLNSPISVLLCSLFSSSFSGGLLIAWNYILMRRPWAAIATCAVAIVYTRLKVREAASIGLPFWLLVLVSLVLVVSAAHALQGKSLRAHVGAGGRLASRWWGPIIGLACAVVFQVGHATWMYFAMDTRTLPAGPVARMLAMGDATLAEARLVQRVAEDEGLVHWTEFWMGSIDREGGSALIMFSTADCERWGSEERQQALVDRLVLEGLEPPVTLLAESTSTGESCVDFVSVDHLWLAEPREVDLGEEWLLSLSGGIGLAEEKAITRALTRSELTRGAYTAVRVGPGLLVVMEVPPGLATAAVADEPTCSRLARALLAEGVSGPVIVQASTGTQVLASARLSRP